MSSKGEAALKGKGTKNPPKRKPTKRTPLTHTGRLAIKLDAQKAAKKAKRKATPIAKRAAKTAVGKTKKAARSLKRYAKGYR